MSHVLMATTGCAGSTLLMAIFSKLGMDVGSEFHESGTVLHGKSVFGGTFETRINGQRGQKCYDEGFPYIIKSGRLTWQLCNRIDTFDLEVDHVYAVIRGPSLWASVKDRVLRGNMTIDEWDENVKSPEFIDALESYYRDLERKTVRLCIDLSYLDVQCTFLSFPRFATDLPLTYKKLEFLMDKYDVSYDRFKEVCDELIDPEVVEWALQYYTGYKDTNCKW